MVKEQTVKLFASVTCYTSLNDDYHEEKGYDRIENMTPLEASQYLKKYGIILKPITMYNMNWPHNYNVKWIIHSFTLAMPIKSVLLNFLPLTLME